MAVFGLTRDNSPLLALAAGQAVDAGLSIGPVPFVRDCLTGVGFPERYWGIFPVIKAASAVGLVVGTRHFGIARLTAWALVVYFILAVAAHLRARDFRIYFGAAVAMLVFALAIALHVEVRLRPVAA